MAKQKQYIVQGTVSTPGGQPVQDLKVCVYDRDPDGDTLLGSPCITNEDGFYKVIYSDNDFRISDKECDGPDLFIIVYDGDKNIAETKPKLNAGDNETINVTVTKPVEPVQEIPFTVDDFKLNPHDLGTLSPECQRFIDTKLNAHMVRQVVESLGEAGEKLREAIDSLNLQYRDFKDTDLGTLITKHVIPALKQIPSIETLLNTLDIEGRPEMTTTIEELLHLDQPIKNNPIFTAEVRRVKTLELADIAKLDTHTASVLANKELTLDHVSNTAWENLVKEGVIDETQQKSLKLTVELTKMTGDNFKFVKALKTDELTSTRDFVTKDKNDWVALMKRSEVETPNGETLEEYAENIDFNIQLTFPTPYFFQRTAVNDKQETIGLLNNLQALYARNDTLFGDRTVTDINWDGIPENERDTMKHSLSELNRFANTYKYLGVRDILNNPDIEIEEKQTAVTQKVEKLKTFYHNNLDMDLRLVNFFEKPSSAKNRASLNWAGIPADDHPGIKKQLMAYQRVMNLTQGFGASEALLANGLDSSSAVVNMPKSSFSQLTGFSQAITEGIYSRAYDVTINVSHGISASFDEFYWNYQNSWMWHLSPSIVNELKDIGGYEALFGSQSYCRCEHCKSILSPAAYFVDLMYFIDTNISMEYFDFNSNHSLYLKNRRPDLWNLQLTCENTYNLIPYLEVVNDVLEQYLGSNIYQTLSEAKNSFKMPFHLPLEELRMYLSHFKMKLSDIFKQLKQEPITIAREQLQISGEELDAVVTADPKGVLLRFGNTGCTKEMDVQEFIKHCGITREELDQLFSLDFIKEIGAITITRVNPEDDIQGYIEKISGLNKDILDRIHRFIRLWRDVPWTLKGLDLVLATLKAAGVATGLNKTAIIHIAAMVELRDRLNLSEEELCALVHLIPDKPVNEGELCLFKRLFEKVTPRLWGGLGISEIEWLLLLQFLEEKINIDADGDYTPHHQTLSRLYRHTKLAHSLNLSIGDFLKAVKLNMPSPDAYISKIEDIQQMIDYMDWLETTPFTTGELWKIVNSESDETEQPLQLISETLELNIVSKQFIEDHKEIFGIDDIKELTLENIKSITFYKKLLTIEERSIPVVHSLLTAYRSDCSYANDDIKVLAEFLQTEKSLLISLLTTLKLSSNPLKMLQHLMACLEICNTLGINGYSLKQLTGTGFSDLQKARDTVYSAFHSKYPNEEKWREIVEPYEDQINMKKRDALCAYILAEEDIYQFKDKNDLCSFFLMDVEMGGCGRTSKVKAAISSLQLYIHRCLVNLEQSKSGDINIALSREKIEEWEWRKNYRVWEANRKVFLYPENWIEPELRDNKTPIFKELEEELLQEKITEASAENAYKKYITQFAEVAKLQIAGNYYHEGTDTLYLFGKTPDDPPRYFWRKLIKRWQWTPWKRIDLAINAPHVSAVIPHGKLYLFWVDVNTSEESKLENGNHTFLRFGHKINLRYSYLNESGKWISPQSTLIKKDFDDTLDNKNKYETSKTYRKSYPAVRGDKIFISYLRFKRLTFKNSKTMEVDKIFPRSLDLYHNKLDEEKYAIGISPTPVIKLCKPRKNIKKVTLGLACHYDSCEPMLDYHLFVNSENNLTSLTEEFDMKEYDPAITIVHNKPGDSIVRLKQQQFLIRRTVEYPDFWTVYRFVSLLSEREMIRLSTTLPDKLGNILYSRGLDAFLSSETQRKNREPELGIQFNYGKIKYELMEPLYDELKHIDFKGAYGLYYQELFFHIPFLIANHLNANRKFKEAKYWYEKIFNPTPGGDDPAGCPDSNWQYIEFRNLDIKKMKEILTDEKEIAAYKKDPFNPHAIARLRLNAYRKSIVMKYIDNLLDWGDDLFARDTYESINEAFMLYILASDILGERPVQTGKCETAPEDGMTYQSIRPNLANGSEFLITLENWCVSGQLDTLSDKFQTGMERNTGKNRTGAFSDINIHRGLPDYYTQVNISTTFRYSMDFIARWNADQIRSFQVFCVPPNEKLLEYWDRVEDRLFKIRHCMNIKGIHRQLALFQPPIDPGLLVKAKAAGLSLEDILGSNYEELPPYRFAYLIEKAKSFTSTVQNFGSALLNTLEKRDTEELTLLRSVHEQNILKLTKEIKKDQIEEANAKLENLKAVKVNVENRWAHYDSLIDKGLTGWELTQQISRHTATVLRGIGDDFIIAGAINYLIPNTGSPFAMTYGGKQTGKSAAAFGDVFKNFASIAESIASSAGLEATFQRREEEWKYQLKLAEQELKQMDQQIIAAEVSLAIAEKDLEIHEKNIEHAKEVYDFYKNKFTNLGLYNYLSTSLTRLYRQAYNLAYDMANLAERAYWFERDDDTFFIENDNWQMDRAGLLAGERLLLQLQQMEKAFIEKNVRDYEITQSFSMRELDPGALLQLKETGTCNFAIPEFIFDVFYPGQYKRMIKSLRLTIPCVTGPYTNVSCKLTLESSSIRKEPKVEAEYLVDVPQQRSTSVATSNANNDGGVFELNFRDERYLPYEGAGAVSNWKLELPAAFRPFNYDTISDVIFHISYTAKDDGVLRDTLQTKLGELQDYITDRSFYRLFSMKHDFPNQWHQFLNPGASVQTTTLTIENSDFPYILHGQTLQLIEVKVFLQTREGEVIDTSTLTLNVKGTGFTVWNNEDKYGDLVKASVSSSENPIGDWVIECPGNELHSQVIENIYLLLKYKIPTKNS